MNLKHPIFDRPKAFFKNKVTYVVGGDAAIELLFKELTGVAPIAVYNPIEAVGVLPDPDILVFTGGHDVSPILYGEQRKPGTSSNLQRDMTEYLWWRMYSTKKDVVKVGICRGAQFLNVMHGGTLTQHLEPGHEPEHKVKSDIWKPELSAANPDYFEVNSTHHQGILSGPNQHVLLNHADLKTTECVMYLPTGYFNNHAFCFQPHPEYNHETTTEAFVSLFEQFVKYIVENNSVWKKVTPLKKKVRV